MDVTTAVPALNLYGTKLINDYTSDHKGEDSKHRADLLKVLLIATVIYAQTKDVRLTTVLLFIVICVLD